jgi:hypothetical protein
MPDIIRYGRRSFFASLLLAFCLHQSSIAQVKKPFAYQLPEWITNIPEDGKYCSLGFAPVSTHLFDAERDARKNALFMLPLSTTVAVSSELRIQEEGEHQLYSRESVIAATAVPEIYWQQEVGQLYNGIVAVQLFTMPLKISGDVPQTDSLHMFVSDIEQQKPDSLIYWGNFSNAVSGQSWRVVERTSSKKNTQKNPKGKSASTVWTDWPRAGIPEWVFDAKDTEKYLYEVGFAEFPESFKDIQLGYEKALAVAVTKMQQKLTAKSKALQKMFAEDVSAGSANDAFAPEQVENQSETLKGLQLHGFSLLHLDEGKTTFAVAVRLPLGDVRARLNDLLNKKQE